MTIRASRLRVNRRAVIDLLHDPAIQHEIVRITRAVEERVIAQNVDTRVDFQLEQGRSRGAVIGGYEHGSTPESTRRALLGALDGVT